MVRHGSQRTLESDLKRLGIDPSRVSIGGKPLSANSPERQPMPVGESLSLRLSIPPHECSPNARCHWAVKARAGKALRQEAFLAGKSALFYFLNPLIHLYYYHKTKRRRDRDNCISSEKFSVDGLADAGLFENDCLVWWGNILFNSDPEDPHLILTIEERQPQNKNLF